MNRILSLGIAVIIAMTFIIGIAYNAFLFVDCLNHGRAAYQCNAALQKPVYIGVENFDQGAVR